MFGYLFRSTKNYLFRVCTDGFVRFAIEVSQGSVECMEMRVVGYYINNKNIRACSKYAKISLELLQRSEQMASN